jgi:hypothetical protein
MTLKSYDELWLLYITVHIWKNKKEDTFSIQITKFKEKEVLIECFVNKGGYCFTYKLQNCTYELHRVCLSACNNFRTAEWIFMKFDTWVGGLLMCADTFQIWLWSDNSNKHFTIPLHIYECNSLNMLCRKLKSLISLLSVENIKINS